MFSRRYLRIKLVQSLYAYQQESYDDVNELEKYLFKNLDQTYQTYVYLNYILREVVDYSSTDVELSKNKYIKSEEEHSTDAWLDFRYIQGLGHYDFQKYFRKLKIKIDLDADLPKRLYKAFKEDPEFTDILRKGFKDGKNQVYALQYLLSDIMMNHEDFDNFMEEHWLNWQDEKDYIHNAVLKTIKACKSKDQSPIFDQDYRGADDDYKFLRSLLKTAIYNQEDSMNKIAELAKNWDVERITLLDRVILWTGITEMENSEVPLRVSLDEYIEIAKLYSTPKSKDFINGVLDKVMKQIEQTRAKA